MNSSEADLYFYEFPKNMPSVATIPFVDGVHCTIVCVSSGFCLRVDR